MIRKLLPILLVCALLNTVAFAQGEAPQTAVVAAGISLEVPPDAPPTLLTARAELEHYLPMSVKSIVVGGRSLKRIVISVDKKLDGDEAWSVAEKNGVLSLAGGGPRGALYATYHFLEDFLEIHWWTPWEESVPDAREWKFKKIARKGKPFFYYRDIWRSFDSIKEGTPRFAVRNRMNRAGDIPTPPELGGEFSFGPPYFVHTFARYIYGQTAAEHPEFLALVDGKRNGEQFKGQLCMTNMEMRDYIVDAMLKGIESSWRDADAAGLPRPIFFDLSQNDNSRFCECERCQKFVAETSITDALIDFVNYVADKVAEKHPEVLVTTLAYGKTVFPPKKIRPRDNVVIRICNPQFSCADIYSPACKEHRESIIKWGKVAKRLLGSDYSLGQWPCPNDISAKRLCDFYRKNHCNAIFIEMSGDDFLRDCFDMKTWLYAKVMEDPTADFEATRQVFLKGYYGPAAPFVDAYRKIVEKAERHSDTKIVTISKPDGFDFYTINELIKAHKLMDDAEKAIAGDKLLETRLMRVRAPMNLITGRSIAKYMAEWKRTGGTSENFPIDRAKLAADMRRVWIADVARFKDDKVAEKQRNMEGQISIMENLGTEQRAVSEPPEFKGHHVQHFCPSSLTLYPNPNMTLIKDADAREGCAYQVLCSPRDQYFSMPFQAGCYDTDACKVTLHKKWDTLPKERGFQWLHLGTHTMHLKYWVFLTGSWEIQAWMEQYLADGPKNLDVWIRMKFEGPRFYPEDAGKVNRMVVDSISLVEM